MSAMQNTPGFPILATRLRFFGRTLFSPFAVPMPSKDIV